MHINISGLRRPRAQAGTARVRGVRAGRSQGNTPWESGRAKEEQMASYPKKKPGTYWVPGTIFNKNSLASSPL